MKKKELEKVSTWIEAQLGAFEIHFEKIATSNLLKFQQRWREVFSMNVKKQTGDWIYNGFDWHTFSYKFFPHRTGMQAIKEYESLMEKKIIIIFSSKITLEKDAFGYILELYKKPSYEFLRAFLHKWPRLTDLYVIHENFSWTFVLTHEDDEKKSLFGPYFAKK